MDGDILLLFLLYVVYLQIDKTGSLIGLIIGVYLLLYCQGLINFQFPWKLVVPLVLILIGIQIIFKDSFSKKKPSQNTF